MENLKKIREEELIQLVKQGDEKGFQELYNRYHKLVFFVAFKMCQNDADAQDVVQESFLEIRRSITDLQKPSYFRLWLYRIINSKCKKLFRKNKYDLTTLDRDDVEYHFLEERIEHTPSNNLRHSSDYEVLHRFIDELPQPQRMAVIMFYMEQFTSAEIAKICDISEGTVKSRLFTARNTLKQKITAYEVKEGVPLDFHDLSAILPIALGAEFANFTTAIPPRVSFKKPKLNTNSIGSVLQANAVILKASALACLSIASVGGGYMAYQQSKKGDQPIVEQALYENEFQTITFLNEKITNSKDAYYALKMKYCKQDLEFINEQEKQEITKVYEALKLENGQYYKLLVSTGWSETFEKIK